MCPAVLNMVLYGDLDMKMLLLTELHIDFLDFAQ